MVQGGKYTKITNEDDHWVSMFITLTDAFTTRPKTGVEFWTRVHQRIDPKLGLPPFDGKGTI